MKVTITMDLEASGRIRGLLVQDEVIRLDPIHFEEGLEYAKVKVYELIGDQTND